MPAIITINDNNLLIQQDQSIARSQGYAWIKGDNVYFDYQPEYHPVRNSRLAPQQIDSQYWQQCAQTSISANDAGMRHSADLIWQHLTQMLQAHALTEVVFVVPSHYQASNLQLLVGIAKSCGIQVVGLLNKAVVALQNKVDAPGQYMHIDLQLHQTVCSTVNVTNQKIKLAEVDVLSQVSIHAIHDALLKAMQNSFIQSDRFDPLHYAETEQQLFDQIPVAAGNIINDAKTSLLVEYKGRVHSISIDKNQWGAVVTPLLEQLHETNSDLSSAQRFIQLNNLFGDASAAQFTANGMRALDESGLLSEKQWAFDASADLMYQTELGLSHSGNNKQKDKSVGTSSARVQDQGSASVHATHLLQAGLAVPLANAHISTDANKLSLSHAKSSNAQSLVEDGRVFVMNDVGRKALQPNDRLGSNLAEGVITVIQVLGDTSRSAQSLRGKDKSLTR